MTAPATSALATTMRLWPAAGAWGAAFVLALAAQPTSAQDEEPVPPALPAIAMAAPPAVETEIGRGIASWYGAKFHGHRTSSGDRFDMHELTAAHKTLPFGTRVKVRNVSNGKEVVVRINDRGPHIRGRIIDLSRAAATALGFVHKGKARVVLVAE